MIKSIDNVERRAFVFGVTASVVANMLTNTKIISIFERLITANAEKEAWHAIFPTNDIPTIFAGEGNILGMLEGKKVSKYLDFASIKLGNYMADALNVEYSQVKDNNSCYFKYDKNHSSLFLGGPVANEEVMKLLGYRYISVINDGKETRLPYPDQNVKKFRWRQLHGDTGYGLYNDSKEKLEAIRYEDGKAVKRAVYKILDLKTKKIYEPYIDEFGQLENEWLTITRIKENKSYKVAIGGLHGHSIEAFSMDLTSNLESLQNLIEKNIRTRNCEFQAIIPVNLEHRTNLKEGKDTQGILNWGKAEIEMIAT